VALAKSREREEGRAIDSSHTLCLLSTNAASYAMGVMGVVVASG
jgi:hypothetical protein